MNTPRDLVNITPPDIKFSRADFTFDRVIKTTTSICPECLEKIPAEVVEKDNRVFMLKTCEKHGDFSALLASDVRHYYVADPAVEQVACCCGPSQHCGDQVENHSCNMLIEITQSCNLTCPTCYAGSSPQNKSFMSLEKFESTLDGLLEMGKGEADLIQLSGGEPTIHPDFFTMLQMAIDKGIKQVYINTNGLLLAKSDFADRIAEHGPKVSIYLQFDGFKSSTYESLRGRDLTDTKRKALENCERLKINTVPIMTLTRGINHDEVGEFIRFATTKVNSIRKVMIQPAMYSGRYDNPMLDDRLTLADVAKLIVEQTDGVFSEDDFTPIPCSDPNCFSMAAAVRTKEGLTPLSRYLPRYSQWAEDGISQLIATVSDTFDSAGSLGDLLQKVMGSSAVANMEEAAVDRLLGLVASLPSDLGTHDSEDWNSLFAIGIKPFMDAYTYDQDRIDKCCVHIISAEGKPVSFCEYNAINRPTGNL